MQLATGIFAAALFIATATAEISLGQQAGTSNRPSNSLKGYLRSYVTHGGNVPPDTATRVAIFSTRIDDGKSEEDIVYISGQGWCGSGGCTMLILEPAESTFRVLGRVTIVQLPIRLLPSVNHGHPDLGVSVHGGGIQSDYEAMLSFNGKQYPGNPSMLPARKADSPRGKVIIGNIDDSVPLYD